MNEKLLQFIWQFQYYQKNKCLSTCGETIFVEKPGKLNLHQGPDFSEAIVRIGSAIWAGNIELHILSSHWYKHNHTSDPRYTNIILHVVWEDDCKVFDRNGNTVPTLVLASRVSKLMLDHYRVLMETMRAVPCYSFLPAMDQLGWLSWKERLVAERLERKSKQVLDLLAQSRQNWDEICWWMLAANFGVKVNTPLFEMMAKSIPVLILQKHRNQVHQIESLLLGQSNLLSGHYKDDYPVMLQKEYRFLRKKYGLHPVNLKPAFLRMRPAAFPTIRLAQLAMLLHRSVNLFSTIKETTETAGLQQIFMVIANDYWNDHYRFDEPAPCLPKQLGKQMADNLLINTVIPVLFAYGLYCREQKYKDRCINWLYQLPAEQNRITNQWQQWGISHHCALDSQALLELTHQYCVNKRCLNCAAGNKILKNNV